MNESLEIKKGIYTPNMNLPVTTLLSNVRNLLVQARGQLSDIEFDKRIPADRVEPCSGLLTCGIGNLYHVIEEWAGVEINAADREFGKSYQFGVRGIGSDSCPCCYVCGGGEKEHYLSNISAFVKSKEEGEKIVELFMLPDKDTARLDFREWEPNWLQVKVGACKEHVHCLEDLAARCAANHGRIRSHDISESRKAAKPQGDKKNEN